MNFQKTESAPAFVTDTSRKTGKSETVIKEEVRIAKNIAPDLKPKLKRTGHSKDRSVKTC